MTGEPLKNRRYFSQRSSVPFDFRRVPSLPSGADIEHPVPLGLLLRKSGARISWEVVSAERSDLTAAALLTGTEGRSFPFDPRRRLLHG